MQGKRVATDAKVRTGCLEYETMNMGHCTGVLNNLGEIAGQCATQSIEMRRIIEDDRSHLCCLVPCQLDQLEIEAEIMLA